MVSVYTRYQLVTQYRTMTKLLSRAQILAANDVKTETVEVPEWGGSVLVRTMTAGQRDAYETALYNLAKGGVDNLRNKARATLVLVSVVDEDGRQLFTEADIEALASRSANAMDRVVKVSQQLNRLGDAQLDELTKN